MKSRRLRFRRHRAYICVSEGLWAWNRTRARETNHKYVILFETHTQQTVRARDLVALHFMLPFLSVILLRQRGGLRCHHAPSSYILYHTTQAQGTCIGMQTYLQIVLTVYFNIERKEKQNKTLSSCVWCARCSHSGSDGISSKSSNSYLLRFHTFRFLNFFLFILVSSISRLWKVMSFSSCQSRVCRRLMNRASNEWPNEWITAKSTKISAQNRVDIF